MELSFALHSPDLERERPLEPAMMKDALLRAMEAARDPSGSSGAVPWRFYLLGMETISAVAWLYARLLEGEVGAEGARAAYEQWRAVPGWIVVTCVRQADEERMERAVEDCLTSVQRCTLSLWSDNVPTNWVTDLISESDELYDLIQVDPEQEKVLGILWYGHPDRPSRGGFSSDEFQERP
jgi:nitroreductase